jgi:hypothetical protein
MHHKNTQGHRVVSSVHIDNNVARELISSSEHTLHKLVKKQYVSADLEAKQKAVQLFIK